MKQVRYIFPISHHYRLPFHERLRAILAGHGVDYRVVYSDPPEENRLKGDAVEIPWSIKVPTTNLPGTGLKLQWALREALGADLTIVQQESKLVLNYVLNLASMLGLKRLAYFGHGRNFQARNTDSLGERWKRFWATKVDWWFGYTDETRRHIESLGFPATRITVFNNAVDTQQIHDMANAVDEARLAALRVQLGLTGRHVGIFVGGLYPDKRLRFLVDAAEHVRAAIPDFELLVVGGGIELPLMRELAASRPWIKVTGPKFGVEKVELMQLAQLFLMPGLVGLAILDAAAAGLPTITTAFPWHSPEIAYLETGVNGEIVEDWENPQAYGAAIADLFRSPGRLAEMTTAATAMAEERTIEAMADNFSRGVLQALEVHR